MYGMLDASHTPHTNTMQEQRPLVTRAATPHGHTKTEKESRQCSYDMVWYGMGAMMHASYMLPSMRDGDISFG
jgi:cytochrome oxidase assembly protein ShyY1